MTPELPRETLAQQDVDGRIQAAVGVVQDDGCIGGKQRGEVMVSWASCRVWKGAQQMKAAPQIAVAVCVSLSVQAAPLPFMCTNTGDKNRVEEHPCIMLCMCI